MVGEDFDLSQQENANMSSLKHVFLHCICNSCINEDMQALKYTGREEKRERERERKRERERERDG